MMRRVGIVVAWIVATAVATMIAATAVGSVRGQVTDVPAIPNAGTAVLLASTTTTGVTGSSTTSTLPVIDPTTTTSAAVTPTSTTTTTTTAETAPSTTSTTVPPPTTTTTTTTTAPPGPLPPYELIGGSVTISANEPDVRLVGAAPKAGYSVEIEESGPGEVEVKFESNDHKSSFRARWEDGELDIEIKEESQEEDGDDD